MIGYLSHCYLLVEWVAEVRVAERSVEGRHARVHQVLKRAPRASIPYISLELRFVQLRRVATLNPACLNAMIEHLVGLETSTGLRKAVMHLV